MTHTLTKEYGVTFAALNMANAFSPGGGYAAGLVAQEENMFHRTAQLPFLPRLPQYIRWRDTAGRKHGPHCTRHSRRRCSKRRAAASTSTSPVPASAYAAASRRRTADANPLVK